MQENAPQKNCTIQLSRSMAEFLLQSIDVLLHRAELGDAQLDHAKLKRIADLVWQHVKPTPEQRKQHLQSWVHHVYGHKPNMLHSFSSVCKSARQRDFKHNAREVLSC